MQNPTIDFGIVKSFFVLWQTNVVQPTQDRLIIHLQCYTSEINNTSSKKVIQYQKVFITLPFLIQQIQSHCISRTQWRTSTFSCARDSWCQPPFQFDDLSLPRALNQSLPSALILLRNNQDWDEPATHWFPPYCGPWAISWGLIREILALQLLLSSPRQLKNNVITDC